MTRYSTTNIEVTCPYCRGNGYDLGMPWTGVPCEDCAGTGKVYAVVRWSPDAEASLLRGVDWLALCAGIACPVDGGM